MGFISYFLFSWLPIGMAIWLWLSRQICRSRLEMLEQRVRILHDKYEAVVEATMMPDDDRATLRDRCLALESQTVEQQKTIRNLNLKLSLKAAVAKGVT